MATKTIAQKLLIKPDATVWSSRPEHQGLIDPLPEGARHVTTVEEATTALLYADSAQAVRDLLTAHKDQLAGPMLWVAYPKGNQADINRDTLWPILAEYDMRPVGQVAVNEVWSAMRYRPLKEGEALPSPGGRR
jgi:hypothetical protein